MVRMLWLSMLIMASAPLAAAQSPRDLLVAASFQDNSVAVGLKRIELANNIATDELRQSPNNYEAALMQAMAIGYRSKLTGNRTEAVDARRRFEVLVRRDPNNADAQIALGAWHLGAVNRLGRFVGRAVLGAQQSVGVAALDKAVALGQNRSFFTGLSGLLRLQYDPRDTRGAQLVEAASHGSVATPLDLIFRRASLQMLPILRSGDQKAIRTNAARMLPLGKFDK